MFLCFQNGVPGRQHTVNNYKEYVSALRVLSENSQHPRFSYHNFKARVTFTPPDNGYLQANFKTTTRATRKIFIKNYAYCIHYNFSRSTLHPTER